MIKDGDSDKNMVLVNSARALVTLALVKESNKII